MTVPLREIRTLAERGVSDYEIARLLGIGRRSVRTARAALGIESRYRRPAPAHGTSAAYRAGCRCLDCGEADATYQRRYRQERQGEARGRPGDPRRRWTPEEDSILLSMPPREASLILDRTYYACVNRRNHLRRTQ